MVKKPEEYARAYANKSINHWGIVWTGDQDMYFVSPVTNYVGLMRGVNKKVAAALRRGGVGNSSYVLSLVMRAMRGAGYASADSPMESGKPDLLVAMPDCDGRIITTCVEVKAFVKGKLDLDIWRENQREWMKGISFGRNYWIWLWGYPEELPKNGFRSKIDREKQLAFLIPGWVWIYKQERYAIDMQGMRTVRMDMSKTLKLELRGKFRTIQSMFELYALDYMGGIFWLPMNHPYRMMIERGLPIQDALRDAGEIYTPPDLFADPAPYRARNSALNATHEPATLTLIDLD